MELWECDNGCDYLGGPGDFYQMSSPDGGNHLMLVCGSCVYDSHLSEWAVDFDSDPRDTVYSVDGLSFLNGQIERVA